MKKINKVLARKKLAFQSRAKALAPVAVVGAALLLPEVALAGDGGSDVFLDIWTDLSGWISGTLGKIIAGAMILVGIIGGIARQSLMAFAIGIGGGMGLFNAPTIIENIVTSTLEHAPVVAPTVVQLTNGLM